MDSQKSYAEYMDEFSAQEIYDGLMRGLFPEKLPPIFTVEHFLKYANAHLAGRTSFDRTWKQYVRYENMRNLNRPRQMGIADPFSYEQLCRCVRQNWAHIKNHFRTKTSSQNHKVSRIHVRKMDGTNLIFKMSYHAKAWNQDPIPDLRIGARYLVHADITNCFPSIYTHSIPWALVGKDEAKAHCGREDRGLWYNQIDSCAQWLRNGETTGLMIGNPASNLLSEIVLSCVDERMCAPDETGFSKYKYVRNIDDYECYAETYDQAEKFLVDLKEALAAYNLKINYGKTKIVELPAEYDGDWPGRLRSHLAILPDGLLSKTDVETLMANVVRLLRETNNTAVVLYAMKYLCKRVMNEEARLFYVKYLAHLAVIYPYLYCSFDKYLFDPFDVDVSAIAEISERMLSHGLEFRNFEECAYAYYFACKYGFLLANDVRGEPIQSEVLIATHDPTLLLLCYLYCKRMGQSEGVEKITKYAEGLDLTPSGIGENWILAYEVLPADKFTGDWRAMKTARVSFVRHLEDILPVCTPDREAESLDLGVSISEFGKLDEPLSRIVAEFCTELSPRHTQETAIKYLNCVIANVWKCSLVRKNVSIPMDRAKYYDEAIQAFGEADISIALLKHVLSWLRTRRYIGRRLGLRSVDSSHYWPKRRLADVLKDLSIWRLNTSDRKFSVIELKDENKRIVKISEMPISVACRKDVLTKINELYLTHTFTCPLAHRDGQDQFFPRLKSVFNNSSWMLGGRLYASGSMNGVDYQCIPSDMRPGIQIDGKSTVELDYSGLHVHMLYAEKGLQLTEDDPYDFLGHEGRSLAKFAMLVVLNAKGESQAVHALEYRKEELAFATGLSPKKEALRVAFHRHSSMAEVVERAKARHARISEFFFSQYALILQNKDSEIALEVLKEFVGLAIPVLPVHDSFIVEKSIGPQLKLAMENAYRDIVGDVYSCPVKGL